MKKGLLDAVNKLPSDALLKNLQRFKDNEATSIADIILYLYEIDTRKLYRDIGHSSLFSFCTEVLNYSEGSAYRRIQAARALKANPEIYFLIKEGKLSLCAVTEISKVTEEESRNELITISQGKTKEEVKALTAAYLPAEQQKKDKIIPKRVEINLSDDYLTSESSTTISKEPANINFTFTMEVNGDFMSLYNKAKSYVGFSPPSEIVRRALEEFVDKREKPTNRKANLDDGKGINKRYIPRHLRKEVFRRDDYQCTFTAPDGHRCTEKHLLQVDHIEPHALGGDNSIENLRLMCPAHNRLLAERVFGRNKIVSHTT